MRRRPMLGQPDGVEPIQMYFQRTAHNIYEWFARCKRKMLFQRVIESIYKAAWDEKKTVLRNGNNPLAEARETTSRIWWEGLKSISVEKRRAEGLVFSRTGPQTFWEDAVVTALGLDWRSKRDKYDEAAWLSGKGEFLTHLAKKWKLPLPCRAADAITSGPSREQDLDSKPSELPDLQLHPDDKDWSSRSKRFSMIVDCQALGDIINGRSPLQDERYRPVFRRMADALNGIFGQGWRPRSDCKDPVCWRERAWNAQADFLANQAMDNKRGHYRVDMLVAHRAHEGNIIVFSDGGLRRASMRASAAWIAFLLEGGAAVERASQRCYLDSCSSAFQAEVIALDLALNFAKILVSRDYCRLNRLSR